jgi:hypothetical protein
MKHIWILIHHLEISIYTKFITYDSYQINRKIILLDIRFNIYFILFRGTDEN